MRIKSVVYLPDFMIALRVLGDGKERTVSQMASETGIDYTHIFRMKKVFIKRDWIRIEEVDMRHDLFLTDKGKEVVNVINSFIKILGFSDNDIKEMRKGVKHKMKEPKQSFEGIKIEPALTEEENAEGLELENSGEDENEN